MLVVTGGWEAEFRYRELKNNKWKEKPWEDKASRFRRCRRGGKGSVRISFC